MITRTEVPPRTRHFEPDGDAAVPATSLKTMADLEKFLEGGYNMILTCSPKDPAIQSGDHASVIVVRTREVPVIPVPTVIAKDGEIKWQGIGEVISLQPFLSMVTGVRRGGFFFTAHVGPTTNWCKIKFSRDR